MRFKKILSFVASAAMTISALCGAMSITASAAATSGTDNGVSWSIANGTLTLQPATSGSTAGTKDGTDASKFPWYASRTSITKVVVKEGITKLGNYAIGNYSTVTSVELPSSLTTIGQHALQSTSLTSLTIPENVTQIGTFAFYNIDTLTTVTWPKASSDITIETSVFSGCDNLTSIPNTKGLTTIGASMYSSCKGLVSVKIPDDVTSIGGSAFSGCSNMTSISFPYDSEITFGISVFNGCSSLGQVVLPNNTKEISENMFANCSKLTAVQCPDTITSIGTNAFQSCTSLASFTLPKNVTSVSGGAFAGCSSLKAVNAGECAAYTNATGNYSGVLLNSDKTELVVYPSGIDAGNVNISSIANTITSVGPYAFYGNTNLTGITLPNNITNIGGYAFQATGLTTVTIPYAVKNIGNYAFYRISGLTDVTFTTSTSNPSQLESIGTYAFGSTGLTKVTLPPNLKTLGTQAFASCASLASATLNDGLESILNSAFSYCTSLTEITIPESVTSLGDSAFSGCSQLTSAKLSNNIDKIGNFVFQNCTLLASVNIPSSATSIGNSAFLKCAIEEAIIPNSVTTLGLNAFQDCKSLKKVVISNQVSKLGNLVFSGCTDPDLEIYLMGTIANASDINAANSFGANANRVTGKIYVYDNTTYNNVYNKTTTQLATVEFKVDLTQLKAALAEAKATPEVNYTANSYSRLASAIALADYLLSDYEITQSQANAATSGLKNALNSLQPASNKEMRAEIAELIDEANKLVESDYTKDTYEVLSNAIKAAEDEVTDDMLNSEVKPYIDAINEALDNLKLSYMFGEKIIHSGVYGTFLEGTVDKHFAGATKIRIVFHMCEGTQFNGATEFKFRTSINNVEDAEQALKGGISYIPGTTSYEGIFNLQGALNEGDNYWFYAYTYNWSGQDVFAVTQYELLNDNDEVIYSSDEPIVPSEDLNTALSEAKAADTSSWTAERKQALQDAINNADEVLKQEYPLPSVIDAAEKAIKDAMAGTSGSSADYSALDEVLKTVPADLSKYTDDSVKALNDALAAVDRNLDASKQDQVDAYVTAIKNAIANLKVKAAQPGVSNNNNNNNTTTVAPSKTTRSPAAVKKDKLAAKKVMKQAKITKLTAKSKAKKKVAVSWKKVKGAKGYQVQVSAKKNFKKVIYKKFVKKNKLTVKSSKIKSKKTYYVRVRAYATYKDKNGKAQKVYSSWNKKIRKVKVK